MTFVLFIALFKSIYLVKTIEIQNETLGNYPFLVVIGTYTDQSWRLTSACSGCIITRRFILTTSHCYRVEEKWGVFFGLTESEKSIAYIDRWILHPNYITTIDATYNDVALVRTEKLIDFEKNVIEPIKIHPLLRDALVYDLNCRMVGWKTDDPESLSIELTTSTFQQQTDLLKTVYSLEKSFLSPTQCKSLINLNPDVNIMIDDTLMCVKHEEKFLQEPTYGPFGSPLLCQSRHNEDEWILMGLKSKQRNLETGIPELFVNIHIFTDYLQHRFDSDAEGEPFRYFCSIQVCGKKYSIQDSCPVSAATEYLERHNAVAENIHLNLAFKLKIPPNKPSHYNYIPQTVIENTNYKLYYGRTILCERKLPHNRPDITLVDKWNYTTYIIDIAIPNTHNLQTKNNEKSKCHKNTKAELDFLEELEIKRDIKNPNFLVVNEQVNIRHSPFSDCISTGET